MLNVLQYIKGGILPLLRQFQYAMPLLIILGIAFGLIGIWWLGPQWVWREHRPLGEWPLRVSASVVLVLIPALAWGLVLHQRQKKWQAELRHAKAVADDASLPHVEEQERAFDANLNSLRKHIELGDLEQLPWYLVLGQEKAGKTSFISRCGQNVSLISDQERADAPESEALVDSVRWWMGEEAVLLDPPGTLISQPAVESLPNIYERLWLHLLDWLDRNRSRRPLNGIVLVLDVVKLLSQEPAQRKAFATLMRLRLNELTQQLGTRLPLYVVLSKVDLLEGFEEFFARQPRAVREDLFGFTFSLDSVVQVDAWLDELLDRYRDLLARLNEQVMDVLSQPGSAEQRHRLLAFERQVSGVQGIVHGLLRDMLGSRRHATSPLVRGVYFSSVCQQGLLANPFVTTAAEPYVLNTPPANAKPEGRALIYFAQRIFQQVIYPEAGLAGDNLKVARAKRRLLLAGSGVAALGCLLVVGGWQFYFDINRDKADSVLAKGREFSTRDIDARVDATGRNLLAPLDQIRDAVAVYGNYREAWPLLSDMGLYQGRAIGPKVDQAYLSLLSKRFLPAIASGVIEAINAAPEGSNQQLAALRVYRMIEDRRNRRPAMVEQWMARQWQRAYPGQGQVQVDLMRHLAYAMKYADADLPQYRQRVAEVQQLLRKIPLAQRVYMSMKEEARERLHAPLDLRNEIGPAFDIVYRPVVPSSTSAADAVDGTGLMLAPLLTAKGFKDYFEPNTQDVTELAMIDQWVLGERQRIDYSEEDRKALTDRIRTLYSADYVDSWRRALNRFSVTDFRDLTHGVAVLEQVAGPTAPLRRLLETLRDNTVIYPSLTVAEGLAPAEVEKTLQQDPARQQAAGIRRAFVGLSDLLTAKGEKPSYYDETLRAVDAVYDYAKAVQDHPDRGKSALKTVLDRFALNGPDPIGTLQRVAIGLPEPLNQQVKKLADQTAQVLVVEALRELEKRWDADIYSFYRQRLAGRYPFNPASASDASLEDFEAFFGPQGRLQQFHDQYLNVFIKDNLDALYSDNHGDYLVRSDVFGQLEMANRIRDTFFNNRGALSVQFSVEPLALSGNRLSSVLGVEGQLIAYSHGPSTNIGLIWPNTLGDAGGSKLTLVNTAGNTESIGYRGPWSLFRLLSRGQLNGRTETSVDLSFKASNGMMRYRITAEKANNPFTQRSFGGFTLPRTLLQGAKATVVQSDAASPTDPT